MLTAVRSTIKNNQSINQHPSSTVCKWVNSFLTAHHHSATLKERLLFPTQKSVYMDKWRLGWRFAQADGCHW